ncbi:hypothetical protein RchiOBHm_Chr5g0032061 [Rosa chinensis]|uniref:Transcription factor WD40-like family n=1 Tax=Rosa chinensis TaxID=74649 RepID=A0A2P6QAB3_ROSCH|nr:hypothetical protein RchiOBHm_Chr5g0032061 [Rosa chinensis]
MWKLVLLSIVLEMLRRIKVINLTASTIAFGDDEGCIKIWDTRQLCCCNSFNA